MAAPNYQATGTIVSGTTGNVSPAWPTHQSGDIAFLVVECAGPQFITLVTASGFQPLTYGLATAQSAGTRLTVWWCRATSSSMTAPTVKASSNHVDAAIVTVRGAITDGDPVEVFGYVNKSTASTTATWQAVTTVTPNTLILNIGARDNAAAGAALGTPTNSSLTSVAKGLDDGTVSGNGGGLFTVSGVLASAGSSGATTSSITSSINSLLTIAVRSQAPTGIYARQRSFSNIYTTGATVVLPANTLPGSLIVVDVAQYNVDPALSDFSDSQANTYASPTSAASDNGTDHLFMLYAKNTLGGSYTLTVTGNSVGSTVVVTEYIGADTTSPLDQATTNGSAGSTTESATIVTTANNELVHVIATDGADDFIIFNPTTGFNGGVQQGDITNYMRIAQADEIQSTAGSITGGFTISSSFTWVVIIASFKAGAASAKNNGFFNFF